METQQKVILMNENVDLTLKALSGKRFMSTDEVFTRLDYRGVFENMHYLDRGGIPTPETKVNVSSIACYTSFKDIFLSLPGQWNQKWFSQDQIVEFCKTFPTWLSPYKYHGAKFLAKKFENDSVDENHPERNLFWISVDTEGLWVNFHELETKLWNDNFTYRHWVVTPKV